MQWAELAYRVLPILGFLICITVVAELSDGLGVFATVARWTARLAHGSVLRLWSLTVAVCVIATTVLSLDTTAVLLTPVVLTLARQLDLDDELFAYTTVWLANTASLLLPVSNLTNLLALGTLPSRSPAAFAALTWPAAVVCIVGTVVALALIFRRSLRGRYPAAPPPEARRRGPLLVGLLVCLGLGPAFALGVNVLVASAIGAAILLVTCVICARPLLRWRLVPLPLVLGVAVLFAGVQVAHAAGLGELLGRAAGSGTGWVGLLRVGGLAGLAANLVDNLPAYLALEPVASGSPLRTAALLVGVNAAPLVTPWASLATLLWAGRCRSAGVAVTWWRFGIRGLALAPLLVLTPITALWWHG